MDIKAKYNLCSAKTHLNVAGPVISTVYYCTGNR